MSSVLSSCRLCGSDEYRIVDTEQRNGGTYTIARCSKCSLVYTRETYSSISPDYISLDEHDLSADHIWLQTTHKEPAFRQCLDLVRTYQSKNQTGAIKPSLLDAGCGIGGWLSFACALYESYGFDASEAQVRYAAAKFPHVRRAVTIAEYQTVMNNALPPFDLITMWDVLEHIRNPLEFLRDIVTPLAPHGFLFASVPAAEPMVLKSRLIPLGWPRSRFSWSPHEHVVYYSPKTLRLLCERCSLKVVKIGSVVAYPRPASVFEIFRRSWFKIGQVFPMVSPEIYVLAQK
jgi:2-polyprenyl-3-methyl-5-hydroxy-6-metoxy-1,4-benzoquinol methylase